MEGGNMFEEIGCFDPNAPADMTVERNFSPAEPPPPVLVAGSTSNSNCSLEDLSEFHLSPQDCSLAAATASFHQLHINATTPSCDQQLQSLMNQNFQDPPYAQQSNNWDNGYQDFVTLGPNHTTPDLLSLLQLPGSSLPPFATPSLHDMIMTSSSAASAAFDRFGDLKNLIPNPTKNDRASIVGEAIDHIKELLRTIEEFKMLLEKKRITRQKNKRGRIEIGEEDVGDENYNAQSEVVEQCLVNKKNSSLRCSWLKRKSKFTEVDVRIIDDEVTIKIVQKKIINCLLFVSKVIDQLQLDLHHVAGAQIGEHHSFLFNTKICEGSSVYASAIADRVMEVLEKHYMEALSSNNGYHCYTSD
ncbi:unnamed protein product [Brassica rapa subsp. trilocularis]